MTSESLADCAILVFRISGLVLNVQETERSTKKGVVFRNECNREPLDVVGWLSRIEKKKRAARTVRA